MWAELKVSGPGPNLRGLCSWAALLHGGVSQNGDAPAAQDQLDSSRDVCHVFPCHLSVC